jgi:predicted metalloenzyme YecM
MKNYTDFLDSFFEQIQKKGIDISPYSLDHIAYQASSSQDYDVVKPQFLKIGQQVHEGIIGGRRVSIFKLNEPIKYKKYSISAIELVESKPGQECDSDFQHAEFVLDTPFEGYIAKYPNIEWDISSMHRDDFAHLKLNFDNGLTLKFLREPILEMAKHN